MDRKHHGDDGARPELKSLTGGSGGQLGVQGGLEGFPVPGQQRVQVLGLGLSADNALEHIGQPSHGIDGVHLRSLDQCHRNGPSRQGIAVSVVAHNPTES